MSEAKNTATPALIKLGQQWTEYAATGLPAKGKTREMMAHAFASGAYIAGMINDSAMWLVGVRGSAALEEWAKATPVEDAKS